MDFNFSEEAKAFGDQVRLWLETNLDPDWESRYQPSTPPWIAFHKDWERRLHSAGWGAIYWPREYGGLDASLETRVIFSKVMAEFGAPEGIAKIGKRLLAPVLIRHGSSAQKARFLPPMLAGEEYWAQGFSEPGAGSDLASLTTRGVVDGNEIVITGQKIWTSHAWYSDWIFALVRTSNEPKKQGGITFVLVPTQLEGVRIVPIRQINGRKEFAETFFDGARVPLGNVIGPIGEGWRIAKALLDFERGAEFSLGRAATIRAATRSLINNLALKGATQQSAALEIGRMQSQFVGAEINTLRLLGAQMQGGEPGALSAVVKLQQSEDWRRGTAEHLRLLGPQALLGSGDHFERYWSSRSNTIASGTSEIQRNIVAQRVLGLPT